MSTSIAGVVTNGVVVPSSPLPEGAKVEVVVVAPDKPTHRPRGVPAEQVRGIASGGGSPPDDDTVDQWLQERRVEKHG